VVESCDDSDKQSWQTEQSSDDSIDPFKWTDYFGKTVVLVEADDPWYLNKDTTLPLKYVSGKFDQDLKYRQNADYTTNVVLDSTNPSMGMGYSYADRQGQPCKKIEIEGFGKTTDTPNVLILLLCVLLFIFVYKTFVNKK